MDIESYLEYVRKEDSGREHNRILVVGPAKTESCIDHVELRPDGDYLFVAGRYVGLRGLTLNAGLASCSFAYSLLDIPAGIVRKKDFGFNVGREGICIRRIKINPEHLLAIARLEDRLAGHYKEIIRETGGYARI